MLLPRSGWQRNGWGRQLSGSLSAAANSADVETSADLSVIDAEVVETAPEQFSLDHVQKQK